MSKRLIPRSSLSNRQFSQLTDFFALWVPAVKAALVVRINRYSAERVYQIIRQHLAWDREHLSPLRERSKRTNPVSEGTGRDCGVGVLRAKWPSLGS